MPALLSDIKRYKQLNIKYTKLKRSCQGVDLPGEPWLEKRGLVTSYWAPGTVWETEEVAGTMGFGLRKEGGSAVYGVPGVEDVIQQEGTEGQEKRLW